MIPTLGYTISVWRKPFHFAIIRTSSLIFRLLILNLSQSLFLLPDSEQWFMLKHKRVHSGLPVLELLKKLNDAFSGP